MRSLLEDDRRWPPLAILACVAALGWIAAATLLPREVRITAQGDWREVAPGLRRSPDRRALMARSRLLVHAHDLPSAVRTLRVLATASPETEPVRLHGTAFGREVLTATLASTPQWLTVEIPREAREIDLSIRAASRAPRGWGRFALEAVALESDSTLAWYAVRTLPPLAGVLVTLALWRRRLRATAVCFGLAVEALAAAALAELWYPAAWLQFGPAERDLMRIAAIAVVWGLALAGVPSPGGAAAALAATVGLLYAPTLRFGLLSDDFLWARPWTARELLGAFAGSEDPWGRTTGTYRPIADVTRALDYLLFGLRSAGHHLTNLALLLTSGILARSLAARLGLGARAALAVALAWVAHPLATAAAAWASQRTDTLAAIFFLACLVGFLAPGPMGAGRTAAVLALAVFALASKEIAVTLPVVAFLADRVARPQDDRPGRRRLLRLLVLVVIAYLAVWVGLFPHKALRGETHPGAWSGFDVRSGAHWLRLVPTLFATIFLPTGYESWWRTPLTGFSGVYLVTGLALAPLAVLAVHRWGGVVEARVGALGLLWPLVTCAPLLGVRPDLYRLGLIPSLAFGLVLGAAVSALESRRRWLPSILMALLALPLVRVSVASIEAWRPDGFFAARAIEWARDNAEWQASLTPDALRLFRDQIQRDEHARVLLEQDP